MLFVFERLYSLSLVDLRCTWYYYSKLTRNITDATSEYIIFHIRYLSSYLEYFGKDKVVMKYSYNGVEFLRRLKEVSGISTQNELANKIGVTQGTISKLKTDPPSGDTLVKIVSNVGCSIDYLLGIEPKKEQYSEPTYPEFLRCVDAIVKNGLGELLCQDTGRTSTLVTTEGNHITPVMQSSLIINSDELNISIGEYAQARKLMEVTDGRSFAQKLRRMWFDKEMEKNAPLTVEGMRKLQCFRDFMDDAE